MTLTPYIAFWSLLAVSVLGLALYRKFVANHEEDYIHLGAGEEKFIPQQRQIAAKLQVLDRWGIVLTVVTTVFGLFIAGIYLWKAWVASLTR